MRTLTMAPATGSLKIDPAIDPSIKINKKSMSPYRSLKFIKVNDFCNLLSFIFLFILRKTGFRERDDSCRIFSAFSWDDVVRVCY